MSSLVLELQKELLDSGCDVLHALRKAHVIAVKLKLNDFDSWIQNELNGYKGNYKDVPDYRQMKGQLKAKNPYHGWIPIMFSDNKTENALSCMPAYESLAELLEVKKGSKDGNFFYGFPAEQSQMIIKMSNMPMPMQIGLFISTHHITEVVERVRNCLLEWTLKLEAEGIMGEGMMFNQEEKATAQAIPQQINNYYGTVVNGDVENAQIVSGSSNTVTYSAGDVTNAVKEIRKTLESESISKDDMESAVEMLEDISNKIDQGKKPGVIKAALVGLRDFVLDVGANVTATLIAAKIQGLF